MIISNSRKEILSQDKKYKYIAIPSKRNECDGCIFFHEIQFTNGCNFYNLSLERPIETCASSGAETDWVFIKKIIILSDILKKL
jgi:hypothetical protein